MNGSIEYTFLLFCLSFCGQFSVEFIKVVKTNVSINWRLLIGSFLCYLILRCVNWDICFYYVSFFWISDVTNQRLFFIFYLFFHSSTQRNRCFVILEYVIASTCFSTIVSIVSTNISMKICIWTKMCTKCYSSAKSLINLSDLLSNFQIWIPKWLWWMKWNESPNWIYSLKFCSTIIHRRNQLLVVTKKHVVTFYLKWSIRSTNRKVSFLNFIYY